MALGLVLSTRPLQGQDWSRYRDLQLEGESPSVSTLTTVVASDAKAIHQQPALVQELEWRWPHIASGSITPQTSPVRQFVFGFYMSNYDRDRTADIAEGGMIPAIATAYGPSLNRAVKTTRTVILPWGLRRAGGGVALTVTGLSIYIQRNSFKLFRSFAM